MMAAVPRVLDLLRSHVEGRVSRPISQGVAAARGESISTALVALPRLASPSGVEVLGFCVGRSNLTGGPGELLDDGRFCAGPRLWDDRDHRAGHLEPSRSR